MVDNDVFINEHDIIEILVCGDQTISSVQKIAVEATSLADKKRAQGESVLILDNLLEIGDVPPEAFKQVVNSIKSSQYDRFAIVGNSSTIRIGANFILKATGKSRQVRYFEDYGKATLWLLEYTASR